MRIRGLIGDRHGRGSALVLFYTVVGRTSLPAPPPERLGTESTREMVMKWPGRALVLVGKPCTPLAYARCWSL